MPLDAGQIIEAGPGLDDDRADARSAASAPAPGRSAASRSAWLIGGGSGIGGNASAACGEQRGSSGTVIAAAKCARALRES